jgi:hypothetical protein
MRRPASKGREVELRPDPAGGGYDRGLRDLRHDGRGGHRGRHGRVSPPRVAVFPGTVPGCWPAHQAAGGSCRGRAARRVRPASRCTPSGRTAGSPRRLGAASAVPPGVELDSGTGGLLGSAGRPAEPAGLGAGAPGRQAVHPGDADFGPPSWDREFDLPAAGALTSRELIVEVAGTGNGQTAIRLDADVVWQPSRPPDDLVPDAARVVTITELASGNPQAKQPPAPVTITGPAVTGRLAALIDRLPVSPLDNEAVSCPAPSGAAFS